MNEASDIPRQINVNSEPREQFKPMDFIRGLEYQMQRRDG